MKHLPGEALLIEFLSFAGTSEKGWHHALQTYDIWNGCKSGYENLFTSPLYTLAKSFQLSHASCMLAGHKQQLQWFRNYIAAVLSTPGQQDSPPIYLLQVFDLRNKLIAISIPLPEVCPAWTLLFMYATCALHIFWCAPCCPCSCVSGSLVIPAQFKSC